MHSSTYRVLILVLLSGCLVFALPQATEDVVGSPSTKATRSADTCADPSLSHPIFQGFNVAGVAHQLAPLHSLEGSNSATSSLVFVNELPAFNAWTTTQNFTFPLFQLGTVSPRELIYRLGTDVSTPPVVSGFGVEFIVCFAYSTQVCGSVPLMSAVLPSVSDSYYTIDPFVHDGLISDGWIDNGVVAFVLPLGSS